MKRAFARLLVAGAIVAVPIARFADAAPNPCRATCKAAKGNCIQAATAAFLAAKTACSAQAVPADRHTCKQVVRRGRASAKAACKAALQACAAECGRPGGATTTTAVGGASTTTSTTTAGSTTTTTSSTLPGPTCGDAESSAVAGITSAHDAVRANPSLDSNGVPQPAPSPALSPLCYSASVAAVAQGWADQCMYMHNANRGNLGENIYAVSGQGSATTPVDAVTLWSAEAQYFDYASTTCSAPNPPGTCLHYTQVVWRDTTAVGCGLRYCTTNSPFGPTYPTWTFVVCDYQPPGNVEICDSHGMNCVLQKPY